MLAVQLSADPAVLLLDEPTRGLDYGAKRRLRDVVHELADRGRAVLLSTHDVEFVADTADRVVVMADGEVVADGPTVDVIVSSPAFAPQVAKILSPQPWLTVRDVPSRSGTGGSFGSAGMSPAASAPVRAIALRPRSTAAVLLMSVVGAAAFGWPLLVDPGAGLAHGTDAPLLFAMLLPLLLAVVLAEVGEGGLDVKAVAMLGVLSAVGAALRPLGAGTAGLETVFFLLILAGRVFGAGFGFVLGATTLGASALVTGGVGPWLPFQMLGAAWVGLGAGLLPRARGRAELGLLAAYGGLSALAYGLLLNLTFWPFSVGAGTQLSFVPGAAVLTNLHHFLLFSAATSLGWDLGRALTNVVLILLTGRTVLGALRRTARRAAFTASTTFEPAGPARS